MKVFDNVAYEQGSADWLAVRMGVITASEMDSLVSPLWKVRTGEGVRSYVARKLAEKWRGMPLPSWSGSMAMEQGKIREEEAIPWFQLTQEIELKRVGFILEDTGMCGCSPDAMITEAEGIEIKCPEPHTHVGYLLDNEMPSEYRAQVQHSMFVTGGEWWKFMSYCRGFPPLILTVKRDPKAQAAIAEAVVAFKDYINDGWDALVALNGGPPERKKERVRKAAEKQDVEWSTIL